MHKENKCFCGILDPGSYTGYLDAWHASRKHTYTILTHLNPTFI